MGQRPDPSEYLVPIGDLMMEFRIYNDNADITLSTLPWAALRVFAGILENV